MGTKEYKMKALTDIWTGDADMKGGRLINTGLLGSIRWWFEVLVRGLGGKACDPTGTKCEGEKHCVVCELFGCTGWARKFRFEVRGEKGQIQKDQIKGGEPFSLCFTPLRSIRDEEWTVLEATLKLIAEYGGLGQKLKNNCGLVTLLTQHPAIDYKKAQKYVMEYKSPLIDESDFKWASLKAFWFTSLINNFKDMKKQSEKIYTFKNKNHNFGFYKNHNQSSNDRNLLNGEAVLKNLFEGKAAAK